MITPGDPVSYELLVRDGHAPAVAFTATRHNDTEAARALATGSADEAVFIWWLHVCEQQPGLLATVADLPSSLPPLGHSLRAPVLGLLASAFHLPHKGTRAAALVAALYSKLTVDDELALQVARAAHGAAAADDLAELFATTGTLTAELVENARRRLGGSDPSDRALVIKAAAEQPPQQRCEWLSMLTDPYAPDEELQVVAAIKDASARTAGGALGPARELFARLDVATQVELLGSDTSRLVSGDLVHHLGPDRYRALVEHLTPQDDSQGEPSSLPSLLGLIAQVSSNHAPEVLLWAHARYNAELFTDARARMINVLDSGYSRRDKPPGIVGTLVLLALLSGGESACKDAALALKSAALHARLLTVRRDFDTQQIRQFLDALAEPDGEVEPSSVRATLDLDVLQAAGAVMAWQMLPQRLGRQLLPEDARALPETIAAHVASLLAELPPDAAAAVGRGLLGVLDVDGPRLLPRSVPDLLHHLDELPALVEPYWVEKLVNHWRQDHDAACRLVDYLEVHGSQLSEHDLEFVMRALDEAREAAPALWTRDHDQRLASALPAGALMRELVTQAESLGRPQALQAPADRLSRLLSAVLDAQQGQAAYAALNGPGATLRRLAEHTDAVVSDLTARWLGALLPSSDVVDVAVTMRDSRLGTSEFTRACGQLAEAAAVRTRDEHLSHEERIAALQLTARASGARARAAALDLLSTSPPTVLGRAAAHLLATTAAQADDGERLEALRNAERDRKIHDELTSALRAVRSGSVGQALGRLLALGRAVADSEPDVDLFLPFQAVRATFQKEVDELLASFADSNKGYLAAANSLAELLVEQGAAAHLLAKGDSKQLPHAEKLVRGTADKQPVGSLIVRQDLLSDPGMTWLSSVQALREFRPAHPVSRGGHTPRDTGDDSRRTAEVLLPMIIDGWALTMTRCASAVRPWVNDQKT